MSTGGTNKRKNTQDSLKISSILFRHRGRFFGAPVSPSRMLFRLRYRGAKLLSAGFLLSLESYV
jgi:hypothetical protein